MLRTLTLMGLLTMAPGLVSAAETVDDATRAAWSKSLDGLRRQIDGLRSKASDDPRVADAAVCAKAAEWIIRHDEFYKPDYVKWTGETIGLGEDRAKQLAAGQAPWIGRAGMTTVLGYVSDLDGSVQPYAVTLPKGFDPAGSKRWPLHLVLHGRGATLNEVSFIHQHEGKPLKNDNDIEWIQLDVFGRTNNAYRWAGEVDVFEALAATKQRFPIDDRRITLWGFSMGGAGAWHLGLHYPDKWSSAGAGAGFVDTIKYQNIQEPLSPLHQKLIRIYDAVDYALNAANVPIIGYGGELDKQLAAAQTMHARGKELGVEIPLLVGPQTEHKFHPDSLKEFMAFHAAATKTGRKPFPGPQEIRFTTSTLKYNRCEWLTIESQDIPYEPSVVEARVDRPADTVRITTKNVALLSVARDIAEWVAIDGGAPLPLLSAAGGLLPEVYYEQTDNGWAVLDYRASREYANNPAATKRHNLQGPIDDAFLRPFVCVRGTGTPWSAPQADWSRWTLDRFAREYDKWLRAELPVTNDTQVTDELIESKNLILFGDPGSNAVLARVVDKLPIRWTASAIEVNGKSYPTDGHAVPLVFPNPLNPHRYVVVNSGHTFHEAEFKASNAQLYPRLGDMAVIAFRRDDQQGYAESVLWSDVFDSQWQFPR
uniref:Peptidase S9 prolyl oligopeptidase catalytic domain-containing protein n=1 Tax=Schlesneria paludicola TaxID=360056 RepID=A0A7C2P0Z1_9PLAN